MVKAFKFKCIKSVEKSIIFAVEKMLIWFFASTLIKNSTSDFCRIFYFHSSVFVRDPIPYNLHNFVFCNFTMLSLCVYNTSKHVFYYETIKFITEKSFFSVILQFFKFYRNDTKQSHEMCFTLPHLSFHQNLDCCFVSKGLFK